MKVLITGVAGFIGYHTAIRLLRNDFRVVGLDNLNDYYDVSLKKDRLKFLNHYDNFSFIKGDILKIPPLGSFSHVIHLAAQAGVGHSLTHPDTYIKTNIEGFYNVLTLAKNHNVENFVYASSSSVYGANEPPFNINMNLDSPLSLYAASKIAGEAMSKSFGNIYKLNNTGLRFFTAYGPWGRPDMFMWIVADKLLKNKPIPLHGENNYRDFTYVDDIVSGIIASLFNPQLNKVYNLNYGQCNKITDIINWIAEDLNIDSIKLDIQKEKPGDVKKATSDYFESIKELGWVPVVPPREGVRKFCKWFKNRKAQ